MKLIITIIRWVFGLIFCISSLFSFITNNIILSVVLSILGLLLLPPGAKFIFKSKTKSILKEEQYLSDNVKKPHIATVNQRDIKPKIKISNSKLNTLISEISTKSNPEYPLLRKEYATVSGMPYMDFSNWVIEQLKQKNYDSLFAFIYEFNRGSGITFSISIGNGESNENSFKKDELRKDFKSFLAKDFKTLFNSIDEQAVYEIQAFFILKRGISDFNREFWIAENKESELLCKILSVYSFTINPNSFEPLIKKANKFLREMRKDVEFWKEYKNYKIDQLHIENKIETTTNLTTELKKLQSGERLYFFDYATTYSYRKFWNGDSTHKTRSYGINENESFNTLSNLEIFETVSDINSIPDIISKGELKELAEKAGFDIKKSWTVNKIFENLLKTEQGKTFLKELVKEKKVLMLKQKYQSDLSNILKYQSSIKRTVDLIFMM